MDIVSPGGEPSRKIDTNRAKSVASYHAGKALREDPRLAIIDQQLRAIIARFPDVGNRYLILAGEEGDRHRQAVGRLIARDNIPWKNRRRTLSIHGIRQAVILAERPPKISLDLSKWGSAPYVAPRVDREAARQQEADRFWTKPHRFARAVITDLETNFAEGWDHEYVNGRKNIEGKPLEHHSQISHRFTFAANQSVIAIRDRNLWVPGPGGLGLTLPIEPPPTAAEFCITHNLTFTERGLYDRVAHQSQFTINNVTTKLKAKGSSTHVLITVEDVVPDEEEDEPDEEAPSKYEPRPPDPIKWVYLGDGCRVGHSTRRNLAWHRKPNKRDKQAEVVMCSADDAAVQKWQRENGKPVTTHFEHLSLRVFGKTWRSPNIKLVMRQPGKQYDWSKPGPRSYPPLFVRISNPHLGGPYAPSDSVYIAPRFSQWPPRPVLGPGWSPPKVPLGSWPALAQWDCIDREAA